MFSWETGFSYRPVCIRGAYWLQKTQSELTGFFNISLLTERETQLRMQEWKQEERLNGTEISYDPFQPGKEHHSKIGAKLPSYFQISAFFG